MPVFIPWSFQGYSVTVGTLLIGSLLIFRYHLKYSVKPNEIHRDSVVWMTGFS